MNSGGRQAQQAAEVLGHSRIDSVNWGPRWGRARWRMTQSTCLHETFVTVFRSKTL